MEENEKEMGATAAGENGAESADNAGENEESKKAEAAAGEEPEGAAEAGAEAPEEEPKAFDEAGEAGEAAPGRTISEEEYAQAIAEAEQRGYLRGRNEQIDALMEESPEAEGVEILQHPRVSIWDL